MMFHRLLKKRLKSKCHAQRSQGFEINQNDLQNKPLPKMAKRRRLRFNVGATRHSGGTSVS